MSDKRSMIIRELEEIGSIKKGNFNLKNGAISKYYFDMRLIISKPDLVTRIGDLIYSEMGNFDIICAIPHGGTPIACYISTKYNKPLIYVRDKIKSYGTMKQIEGKYEKTDRCVIIDDVMTTGKSIIDVNNILKTEVNVVQCNIIIDRQECYTELPIPVKSLFTKTDYIRYQLNEITISKKNNLIFSADISCPIKLLQLIKKIGDRIIICKLHLDCIEFSLSSMNYNNFKSIMIQLSVEKNFLIMEDRKFVDISSIVMKQFKTLSSWVDLVTVHGSVNQEVLKKLNGIVIVSNMSNNNWNFDKQSLCYGFLEHERIVGFVTQYDLFSKQNRIKNNSQKNELFDLCSSNSDFEKYLNDHRHLERRIFQMTPGISLNSKKEGDQNYKSPDKLDTDFMIVGRAVYYADDPIVEIEKLCNNSNQVWSYEVD